MISFRKVLTFASIMMLAACGDDNSSNVEMEPLFSSSAEESSSSSEPVVESSSSEPVEESSSSESAEESSSSELVEESSSSEVVEESSSSVVYGKLVDERDGQEYRTVVIGDDTWMADNLNYDIVEDGKSRTVVRGSHPEYGRYYSYSQGLKEACPEGWHLPRYVEFRKLLQAVGPSDSIGNLLKNSEGWENNEGLLNPYGFSALPTGYRTLNDAFFLSGAAIFLTAEAVPVEYSYMFRISDTEAAMLSTTEYSMGPIRCIKDQDYYQPLPDSASFKREDPCNTEEGDNCKYGTLVDERDNRSYKTVIIGSQEWMAENLQYGSDDYPNAACYHGKADSCAKYGRAYTWSAAMDSTATFSTAGQGCGFESTVVATGRIRGVCPAGWHLPSDADFLTLMHATGTHTHENGAALQSVEGWNTPGKDSYGFSVVPSGVSFEGLTFRACFWSSHEFNQAYALTMSFSSTSFSFSKYTEDTYCAVRCLKD